VARTRSTQLGNEARPRIKRALNPNRRLINLPQQRQQQLAFAVLMQDAVVREPVAGGVPDLPNGDADGVSVEPEDGSPRELRPTAAHSASVSDPESWIRLHFWPCVFPVPQRPVLVFIGFIPTVRPGGAQLISNSYKRGPGALDKFSPLCSLLKSRPCTLIRAPLNVWIGS
jgi:hypothetical protein